MELTQDDLRAIEDFKALDPERRRELIDHAAELIREQRAEQSA